MTLCAGWLIIRQVIFFFMSEFKDFPHNPLSVFFKNDMGLVIVLVTPWVRILEKLSSHGKYVRICSTYIHM